MCDNKASVAPFIYFCTAAEAMAGILSSSLVQEANSNSGTRP